MASVRYGLRIQSIQIARIEPRPGKGKHQPDNAAFMIGATSLKGIKLASIADPVKNINQERFSFQNGYVCKKD
jgi:hypothetical protein